jgi:hypothetical protein
MRKDKVEGRKVKKTPRQPSLASSFVRRAFLTFLIFNFSFLICYAADFGLLVDMYAEADNEKNEKAEFEFKVDIFPHISFLLNDSSSLFLSAGIAIGNVGGNFNLIPELLRNEFTYRPGNWEVRVGRIVYTDPLGFIAAGLFDGVQLSASTKAGIFSAGAWYTGMLYKKNAVITMTAKEQDSYNTPFDFGDFFKTYFAPNRFLASIDWEHPSVGELVHLRASVTAQADLTDTEEKYHSQYFTLKATLPVEEFVFELGGSLETVQAGALNTTAFALDAGVFWMLSGSFDSRLSLTGRFTSGNTDGNTDAFVPVTGKFHGNIIRAKMSGITMLSLDYGARLAKPFAMGATASHFVRNDLGTYTEWPVNIEDNSGYFLGTEFYAWLVWNPLSDLQLNLGGGVFLPALGNVNPDEKPRWRVELTVILAAY